MNGGLPRADDHVHRFLAPAFRWQLECSCLEDSPATVAACCCVYVVVEELIPESHREGNVDLVTVALMLGFAVMMVLDVALG